MRTKSLIETSGTGRDTFHVSPDQPPMSLWLDWQMKGRTDSSRFFLNADSRKDKYFGWDVKQKNW